MPKMLTKIWKTEDGKFFETQQEAEDHEALAAILRVIRQAEADACHDKYGPTMSRSRKEVRFAEELLRAGFRYTRS